MEILITLGVLVVVFLIESQIYLSFMQYMHRKLQAKIEKVTSGGKTNAQIVRAAKDVFGYHKMSNQIANASLSFMKLAAWVSNIGMIVCFGASIYFFFTGGENYAEIAYATVGVYLLWLAAKWSTLILTNLIADTAPGAPAGALELIYKTDFDGDLSAQIADLHRENPELEELERALKGEDSELEEVMRVLRASK